MLTIDFFILVLSIIVSYTGLIMITKITITSPLLEMKILFVAIFSLSSFFIIMLPFTYLYPLYANLEFGTYSHRIAFFFAILGNLLWVYAFILPVFTATYRSFFSIAIITAINVAAIAINCFSITEELVNNVIEVKYVPLGLLLFILSVVLFAYIIIQRVRQVLLIVKRENYVLTSTRSLIIFFTLISISLAILVVQRVFPIGIPMFGYLFPVSLTIFYFIYAIVKDPSFFFITTAKLEAIIITESKSGINVYSKSFANEPINNEKGNDDAEIRLSGIFTALNISLTEMLQSTKGLNQINFGDKVILIAKGTNYTNFMIVSELNNVTQSISNFIIKEFEKQFKPGGTTGMANIIKKSDYASFNKTIELARAYIPL